MAKKYFDGQLKKTDDWGSVGEEKVPATGRSVQEYIKGQLDSKAGYLGKIELQTKKFFVLARDEEAFGAYKATVTESHPDGDTSIDGFMGKFDAPFEYKMNITIDSPENGIGAYLYDDKDIVLKFRTITKNTQEQRVPEGVNVTYKISSSGNDDTSYSEIYTDNDTQDGIEFDLNGKLSDGDNTIIIMVTGRNTNSSTIARVTIKMVNIYVEDKLKLNNVYRFNDKGKTYLNITYDFKGAGDTYICWYIDGKLAKPKKYLGRDKNGKDEIESFQFTASEEGSEIGKHTLQYYLECVTGKATFHTPIQYKEFILETLRSTITTPHVLREAKFDYFRGIVEPGYEPKIYNVKQYSSINLRYAIYYTGKCILHEYIKYITEDGEEAIQEVSTDKIEIKGNTSDVFNRRINVNTTEGDAQLYFEFVGNAGKDPSFTTIEVIKGDFNLETDNENVSLFLSAAGRNNTSTDRDVWEFTRKELSGGQVEEITTRAKFSNENHYVVFPEHMVEENAKILESSEDPEATMFKKNNDYDYVKYNGRYYVWERAFDWSETSGWNDDSLVIGEDNAVTIDFNPLNRSRISDVIKEFGCTFEFELKTTNVYDDNAVLCSIYDTKEQNPAIIIKASETRFNMGLVSIEDKDHNITHVRNYLVTKYKPNSNVRIGIVISPDKGENQYSRIVKTYVNGVISGAERYDTNYLPKFAIDSPIVFRGNKNANVEIKSLKFYDKALNDNQMLDNFIYYRNDYDEKVRLYNRNNIMATILDEEGHEIASPTNDLDINKLKPMLPIMTFYQTDSKQPIEILHQETKDKKKTVFFHVVYEDLNHPEQNFVITDARITPQGTSSMAYPVKNFRIYTKKKVKKTRMWVGENIFKNPTIGFDPSRPFDNLRPEAEIDTNKAVGERSNKYAFKPNSIPVNCWCLKADFAESSSSHNTGTARYWNEVLVNGGLLTKAQLKAEAHKAEYPYDVRTCVDGFPIALFYRPLGTSSSRFEGKYNFNNDKSTEEVYGFTGGAELSESEQPYVYYYIGKEKPWVLEEDGKFKCSIEDDLTTEEIDNPKLYLEHHPDKEEIPLYAMCAEEGKYHNEWFMLRGQDLLDNPRMECWELRNSFNDLGLFKTAKLTFGDPSSDNPYFMEKVGTGGVTKQGDLLEDGDAFSECFESRYPDCGDYYHVNNLREFCEWMVSCLYLYVDNKTGKCKIYDMIPPEYQEYDITENGRKYISIKSLTEKKGSFNFEMPGKNYYKKIESDFSLLLKPDSYAYVKLSAEDIENIDPETVTEVSDENEIQFEVRTTLYYHLKNSKEDKYFIWTAGNFIVSETDPLDPGYRKQITQYVVYNRTSGDGSAVKECYEWNSMDKFENYHPSKDVKLPDTAENRALKFFVEKWDHIDMDKMAAYYIYLMRFGGVDQTVKNAMFTTEGSDVSDKDPKSHLPSKWFYINYDNDTILGVKNDGHLVFDPYITRETKDGETAYVYAGRESTLWNNLEADKEFMATVANIDSLLIKGDSERGGNEAHGLSFNNAIRQYETTQTNMWPERLYNKDADTKYIDSYITGRKTLTKQDDGSYKEGYTNFNFLYDVQGNRNEHRRWWISRRYNIFDSKFANDSFKNAMIRFRSDNLEAGSKIKITSGEPVYYAWGHDNAMTEMTPEAIQPNHTYEFINPSYVNIGSYLELYGAPNISELDLRYKSMKNMFYLSFAKCAESTIEPKMRKLLIGDHEHPEITNTSTNKFDLDKVNLLKKLEVLDVTGLRRMETLGDISDLRSLEELYAYGTSIARINFAEGCALRYLEAPTSLYELGMKLMPNITYDNIHFDGNNMKNLTSIKIDNCPNLMHNTGTLDKFPFFTWLNLFSDEEKKDLQIEMYGIDWVIRTKKEMKDTLYKLKGVGINTTNKKPLFSGKITINDKLTDDEVFDLQEIFGDDCFSMTSATYITAHQALYIVPNKKQFISQDGNRYVYEGLRNKEGKELDYTCNVVPVGLPGGRLTMSAVLTDSDNFDTDVNAESGDVTARFDEGRGIISFRVNESNNSYLKVRFWILFTEVDEGGHEGKTIDEHFDAFIWKRNYPDSVSVSGVDAIRTNNKNIKYTYTANILPTFEEGDMSEGYYYTDWTLDGEDPIFSDFVFLDKEKSGDHDEYANVTTKGFDGRVTLKADVKRVWDGTTLCSASKSIDITDPGTIITESLNKEIYDIFKTRGLIPKGMNKITIDKASNFTPDQFIIKEAKLEKDDERIGKSIFYGHDEIKKFPEFGYFTGITELPDEFFYGCSGMKEVTISAQTKHFGNDVFTGCTSLQSINCLKKTISGSNTWEEGEILPLISVGNRAFSRCKSLKKVIFDNVLESIGSQIFKGCESLTETRIFNEAINFNPDSRENIFEECRDITFSKEHYAGNFEVIEGNLFFNKDSKKYLVHMGKGLSLKTIPRGETIYAMSYSMEFRTEPDVEVPENIVLNCNYAFYKSVGNKITLKTSVPKSGCGYLFSYTDYKNGYFFKPEETIIPDNCFGSCSSEGLRNVVVPNNIERMESGCFYGCTSLENIEIPATVKYIGDNSFWLCNRLKNVYIKSPVPPRIKENEFFNVMLDNIYFDPDYYEAYHRDIPGIFEPFLTPKTLFKAGTVRIIRDGKILFSEQSESPVSNVTIGTKTVPNGSVTGFMAYENGAGDEGIEVKLDGEKIGEIRNPIETIYLGNNKSLFSGEGFDFTIGEYAVSDSRNEAEITDNKDSWKFDKRFRGLRSKELLSYPSKTEISFTMKEGLEKPLNIVIGQSCHDDSYGTVSTGKGEEKINLLGKNGWEHKFNMFSENGKLTFRYNRESVIRSGIDGMVINRIGNVVYSDPEVSKETTPVTVTITSITDCKGAVIAMTDGKGTIYRKIWNGSPVTFNKPSFGTFEVYMEEFINQNGKTFEESAHTQVGSEGSISIEAKVTVEVVEKDYYYICRTKETDIYVKKQPENETMLSWTARPELSFNDVDIMSQESSGFTNTNNVLSVDSKNEMFNAADSYTGFGVNISGFIPSYSEMVEVSSLMHNVSFANAWTSDSADQENAWTSDGEKANKSEKKRFFIFGKKLS